MAGDDVLCAELLVLGGMEIEGVEGGAGLHAGDRAGEGRPVDALHGAVFDREAGKRFRSRAFCHELGKVLRVCPGLELALCRGNELALDPVKEGAGAVLCKREGGAVLVCEAKASDIGREGTGKLFGELLLLRRQDGILADLHDLAIALPEMCVVAVGNAFELPLVCHICMIEVVDRAVAAGSEDSIGGVHDSADALELVSVVGRVARGAGKG